MTVSIDLWTRENVKTGFHSDWTTKDGEYSFTPPEPKQGIVTARLIYSRGKLDFLTDRKTVRGDVQTNIAPVLFKIIAAIEALAEKEGYRLDNTSDNFAVGHVDEVIFIGTPNQSYGYFYLTIVDTTQ